VRARAVAAIAGVVALAAGCGGSTTALRAATLDEAHAAIVARLDAKHLTYRWVACVATGRRYRDLAVVRCNVNFGDPHIVAYCTVLRGSRAVTQIEVPGIPCGPDDAGWTASTVSG
jgi:hypothetical protein